MQQTFESNFSTAVFNIPHFLSTRIKQKPNNDKLLRHMMRQPCYRNYVPRYSNKEKKKTEVPATSYPKPKIRPINRSLISTIPYHLPPNKYNPKLDAFSRNKNIGTYWSRISRQSSSKYLGTHRFYDLSGYPKSCEQNKYVFASNPRHRKPTTRLMIFDPTMCYRDPNDPGPADYYPRRHVIENNVSRKIKSRAPLVYKFLPNSIVPAKESYLDKHQNTSAPGPGRFNPVSAIAAPVKNCIYDPEAALIREMEAIKKFRRLPYRKLTENYCEDAKLRCIPGHGHTYRFRGKENWTPSAVSKRPADASKAAVKRPMFLGRDYRQMINDPERIGLSVREEDEVVKHKPISLRINCLAKPVIRRKTKENQRVAFMSVMPRWKEEETGSETIYKGDLKTSNKTKKKLTSVELRQRTSKKFANLSPRFNNLPEKYRAAPMIVREKYFKFTAIPPPKILVRSNEIGDYGTELLSMFTQQSTLESFCSEIQNF